MRSGPNPKISDETKEEETSYRKYGVLNLWELKNNIFGDITEIGVRAQPLARNWGPLLKPVENLLKYLTEQVAKMSDPAHPDPSWKNLSKEALAIIKKLKPIIKKLSEEKLNIIQTVGDAHHLLELVPKLLIELNQLGWHEQVGELLQLEEELKHDFPILVLKLLQKNIPQFENYKATMEEQFNYFLELDNEISNEVTLLQYNELSLVEKMGILTAMEEFNSGMEKFILALNRISLELGIPEGYLLTRGFFIDKKNNKEVTITDLCEKFTRIYKKALAVSNAPMPAEDTFFPYEKKVIFQQKALLADKTDEKRIELINKVKDKSIAKIILKVEKIKHTATVLIDENTPLKGKPNSDAIKLIKKNADIQQYASIYLINFKAIIATDKTKKLKDLHNLAKKNIHGHIPEELEAYVENIIDELKKRSEVINKKFESDKLYNERRVKRSVDRRANTKITSLLVNSINSAPVGSYEKTYLTQFLNAYQQNFKDNMTIGTESGLGMKFLLLECSRKCADKDTNFFINPAISAKLNEIVTELDQSPPAIIPPEEKPNANPVAVTSNLSRVKTLAAEIYQNVKETKLVVDARNRDHRTKNIIGLIQKELSKYASNETKNLHLKMFLTIFETLIKDSKKDMNKIIKEAMVRCRLAEPDFALDNNIVNDILDRHNFSAISRMENGLKYLHSQLKVMLDNDIYNQFVLLHPKLKVYKGNGWIQPVGLTLAELTRTLEKYRELSAFFASENLDSMQGVTPKEQLFEMAKRSKEFSEVCKKLVQCLLALEKDPHVKALLSVAGMKEMIFPSRAQLAAEIQVVIDIDVEQEEEAQEEKPVAPSKTKDTLEVVFDTIARIYKKSAEKYLQQDDPRISETVESLAGVKKLITEYNALKNTDASTKIHLGNAQIFAFLLNHTQGLYQLLNDLSRTTDALSSVAKKEFAALINELNLGLRDMILLFGRIEIEFNLKPGYLTKSSLSELFAPELRELLRVDAIPADINSSSLHSIITAYYAKLNQIGYTFPANEQYPFTQDLIAQQNTLLNKATANTIKKEYISRSIFAAKQNKKSQHVNANQIRVDDNRKEARRLDSLVDAKIHFLGIEVDANTIILQNLLRKLVSGRKVINLEARLREINLNSADRKNMHLLYQGHNKKLMTILKESTAKRKDLLAEVELSIKKLTPKRAHTYFFFARHNRTNLENTIEAYRKLKVFLAHPGAKVTDFSTEEPFLYKLLVAHDQKLLEKLLTYSEQSFYLRNQKRIAGDVYLDQGTVFDPIKAATQEKLVSEWITKLQSSRWYITNARPTKIKLLQALKEQLRTQPLDKALNKIRQDKSFKDDYYLLHEGRTGKLLDELSQLDISKKEIMHEISLEITRLGSKRQDEHFFFDKSKKLLIENRILACEQLKLHLEINPDSTVDNIVRSLAPEHRQILVKHEAALLKKLKTWQATNERLIAPPVNRLA